MYKYENDMLIVEATEDAYKSAHYRIGPNAPGSIEENIRGIILGDAALYVKKMNEMREALVIAYDPMSLTDEECLEASTRVHYSKAVGTLSGQALERAMLGKSLPSSVGYVPQGGIIPESMATISHGRDILQSAAHHRAKAALQMMTYLFDAGIRIIDGH